MSTLEEIRAQIDAADRSIVELLNTRARLALQVKEAKEKQKLDVYSPAREREILEKVRALGANGPFPVQSLDRIFREIVSATRSLVGEFVVAYVGPEFSVTHTAALKQFGEQVRFNPGSSIADIFKRVEQGSAQYGVVPAESSTNGLVTATYEAFLESTLQIVAEVELPIQLDLVAKGATLSGIKRVMADASSFLRAERWLRINLPTAECVVVEGGALVSQIAKDSAAIIPQGLAEKLQLTLIASNIADEALATSRSFVIGHTGPGPTKKDKTSLICTVQDRAGALAELLSPFQRRQLSLSKIESRPLRSRASQFMFMIDVLGHREDEAIQAAVQDLNALSVSVRILGSYPAV